ncbi:phage tail protein [Pantoea stewartii]|uniref:phage tail protein n=1 Tax=Pantoea stewartii TaxID=66269 RepID=UPI0021D4C818|nr:phage tail protein [Pantoea stewartii]MCU7366844.1 phage tail protein [Pantoea stewartii]
MTTKYFAILTNQGAAKLANAAALGTQLQITQMAVGDGGGTLPTPDPAQTKLVGEKRRAALNSLKVDAANTSQIIAEQIIPEGEGGFWIREIGLYDADGVMVAVANCAETYKPQLQEGSGRTQTVRMILIVNSTSAVTLKIDPSVVLATRQYVDDKVIEVKAYTDDVMKKHVDAANPHSQYLQTAKALAEIKDAGLVAEVLKNLGLSDVVRLSDYSVNFSDNGWVKWPNGLIYQWGISSITNATMPTANVTFPIPFPTELIELNSHDFGNSTTTTIFQFISPNRFGFTASNICTLTRGSTQVNGVVNSNCKWAAWGR